MEQKACTSEAGNKAKNTSPQAYLSVGFQHFWILTSAAAADFL